MPQRNFSLEESDYKSYGALSAFIGINAADPASSTARLTAFSNSISRLWLMVAIVQFAALNIIGSPAIFLEIWAMPLAVSMLLVMVVADLIVILAPSAGWRFNLWRGHVFLLQAVGAAVAGGAAQMMLFAANAVMVDNAAWKLAAAHLGLAMVAFTILSGNRVMFSAYAAIMAAISIALFSFSVPTFSLLVAIAMTTYAVFHARRRDEHVAKKTQADQQASERAALLLSACEDSGSNIFWETDRQGKISYVSPSVARQFGKPDDNLVGRPLSSLLASEQRDGLADDRTLGFHMSARSAFNDLAVRSRSPGETEQWWSISGKPIYNDLGHFLGFRGHGTDLTAVKRSEQENTQLARYDALTGLANRLYIKQLFEKALISQSGHHRPCAVFLLDLDKFKQVNDTLGHPIGDLLLQQVARRILRVVDETGQVGRLGGDEFQIVLPQQSNRDALATLAENLIQTLSKPYFVESHRVTIGASIGIAIFDQGEPDSAALIRNADLALYAAKAGGRATFRFYKAEMHQHAAERQRVEDELRTALSEDQFDIYYQPVVNVSSEMITGFEALIRWDNPRHGRYSPAKFIPIAEEVGLIAEIGEWVLRNACEQAVKWPRKARVAVNVSPVQFLDPSFVSTLVSVLAATGLDPDRLELEITEGIFLNESDETFRIFQKLKQIGVRLVLDDFGTGYSALGYLQKAPFDKIKIDQSFVRGASQPGSINSAIISSIVTLAESLNMETTAEGAETHEELERVRALGCSHLQGYIFGKPMPFEEAAAMLENNDGRAVAEGFARSRERRIRMLRKVALYHNDYCYEANIRNLSANGALIEGLWDVPVGARFTVQLDKHRSVDAEARWSSENRMGVRFAESIDVDKMSQAPKLNVDAGPVSRRKAS